MTSLTWSSSLSLGFGMKPAGPCDVFAFPIFPSDSVIKAYCQGPWQALSLLADALYCVQYDVHFLLGKFAMSNLWPILVIVVWGALCIATAIQNSRLLRVFRDRYPAIAARELPMAWDGWRHPEKAIFFFRKRAVEVLRPLPD